MPSRARFAFLIHPRTDVSADLANVHPLLGLVPNGGIEWAMRRAAPRPWVYARIEAADRPGEPFGEVIAVPLSPRLLLGDDRALVRRHMTAALDLAARRGAAIVGLGALTATATRGGLDLQDRTDIGVTNGNAYTAVATVRAIERIASALPQRPTVALVGATGSVGAAVARDLARSGLAERLLLVGRTPSTLAALAGDLGAAWSTELRDCRTADVVVLMTAAADHLLQPEHLKRGAIVLDDTQPRNTGPDLAAARPDVTVVDGGLVLTPGLVRTGGSMTMSRDRSFACLAETALLALAGHRGHATVGRPTQDQVDRTRALGHRWRGLGFDLAPPTSFGRPVEVPGWGAADDAALASRAVA